MKGGHAVSKILKMEGTEFVTLYPMVSIINELLEEKIRMIIPRHERTAVAIADAYTRCSMGLKNGVCLSQSQHGSQNILGGLAQAYDDLSPILMLPNGVRMNQLDSRAWDSTKNLACVVKWAARVNSATRVPELMRMAYTRLRTGRPSPVLLELMTDAMAQDIPDSGFDYEPVKGWKYAADPHDVETAVRALLAAKHPLIYVGDGIFHANASNELLDFVELIQVPVATNIKGKSAFPENHPLSVGMRGRAFWMCMGQADLVFGIGTSLSGSFSAPVPPGKTVVQCNIDEYDVNRVHRTKHAVIGDSKLVLRQLIAEVRKQTGGEGRRRNEKLIEEIAKEKELQLKQWLPKLTSKEVPINPYRVIWDMMQTFDRKNLVITHDSGNPREQLTAIWEATTPRSYLGWGYTTNLGFSWGAMMGAKLAFPKKLCVNWVGDAAVGHQLMDMETSLREKLPILTVVSNNSGYAVYGVKGKSLYPDIVAKNFVSPSDVVSYAKVAEGLGCYGERVEEPDEVIPALKRGIKAVQSGRPALIEVITSFETERIGFAPPPGYEPGKS